ncbi:MAG: YihY/virulence factor BrkB family protein [Acidimicrobiales bacterium]
MLAGIRGGVETLPSRWSWLGLAVAVQKRFGELHGGYLAAAVTMAAFLSLFPLVLVAIAVVGFFSAGSADLPVRLSDVLGLPPDGEAAQAVTRAVAQAEAGKAAASVVGLAGLLWTGLGLVGALAYVLNAAWQVKGRGWRDKVLGLAWLVGASALFVISFAVTAVVGFLPSLFAPVNLLVGMGVSTGLFLWSSKVLCNRDVGWRPLVPGAVVGAVGFEVLKVVGGVYVPRAVASSSALYGSIGVVFAILAWLFLFGRLLVYASIVNVVTWERRHGTVTVELEVPSLPGEVPLRGTRAGESAGPQPATG